MTAADIIAALQALPEEQRCAVLSSLDDAMWHRLDGYTADEWLSDEAVTCANGAALGEKAVRAIAALVWSVPRDGMPL